MLKESTMVRGVLIFGFLLLVSSSNTAAQEATNTHRYRMTQLEGLVEEVEYEDFPENKEAQMSRQSFSGTEEVNEQGVVVRTQSVHTSDIVS